MLRAVSVKRFPVANITLMLKLTVICKMNTGDYGDFQMTCMQHTICIMGSVVTSMFEA